MLLKTEALCAGYGSKQVLHDIAVEVAQREIVAFIGHNGAGKSTLLKAIFGVVPVSAGMVWFKGADITNRAPYRNLRDGLAYCLQGGQVFSELAVEDNLRLARETMGKSAAARWDGGVLLELFPVLYEKRRTLAGVLSGGERQLLAFAMTLLSRPQLCLLDEPSAGLAPIMVERIGELIRRINQDLGVTVLLVEQNVSLAIRLAHRVYVQANGRVVFEGTPDQLKGKEAVRALRGF
ncbi:MAG: ABC transporter ATP-binding protein [Chloroflexi bacterium]|nr:ABC transporter ATP-binding protein [Chloroflexota bacterium]